MFRKSVAMLLVMLMVISMFTSYIPVSNFHQVSFADVKKDYQYGDGTGAVDLDQEDLGALIVQDYDVSNIDWASQGAHEFWTRENMFREGRVKIDESYKTIGVKPDGYVDGFDDMGELGEYYNYLFYRNGNASVGGKSKSARRIMGYFVPDETATYSFKILSDDGHYFQLYDDDIYYDPKYKPEDSTDYDAKWEKFYNNGILEQNYVREDNERWILENHGWWRYETYSGGRWYYRNYVKKDSVKSTMSVGANVHSTTVPKELIKSRVYPMYMEYFNWGGGGYFEVLVSKNGGNYTNISNEDVYSEIANPPGDNGSGIDVSIENGVRIVHGYDNFEDKVLDNNVWENNSGFVEKDFMLVSNNGKSKINLKNEYINYDSYVIQLDLIGAVHNGSEYSYGGIGISSNDDTWVHRVKMNKANLTNRWYREFAVQKYDDSDVYKEVEIDSQQPITSEWQEKSVRMIVTAIRNSDESGYTVTTKFYNKPAVGEELGDPFRTVSTVERDLMLDFSKISLVDNESNPNWTVRFDNFDFLAKKDLKFRTLKVTHNDNQYLLDWEPLNEAKRYFIFYEDGSTIKKYYVVSDEDGKEGLTASETEWFIPDNDSRLGHKYFIVAVLEDEAEVGSNRVYVGGDVKMSELSLDFDNNSSDCLITWTKFDSYAQTGNIDDSGVTYSLYYGDKTSSTTTPVPNAQGLSRTQTTFLIEQLDKENEYYNKYIQLVATYDYGVDAGSVDYYSIPIKIEAYLRLGVIYENGKYTLSWTQPDYVSYNKYKLQYYDGSNWNNVNGYTNIDKSTREIIIDFNHELADDKLRIVGVGTKVNGKNEKNVRSNFVELVGNVTVPTLSWRLSGDNSDIHHLSWNAFPYSDIETIVYYGDSIDEIDTVMSEPKNIGSVTVYNTSPDDYTEYMDKYMKVKFIYKDIPFYTNIVRSAKFDEITGTIDIEADTENKKLDIEWEAISGVDEYELYYYPDGGGDPIAIELGIDSTQTTILDIYNDNDADSVDNSIYLDKEIFVVAVFKIESGGEIKISSPVIVPRKVIFESLDADISGTNFDMTWSAPTLASDDSIKMNVQQYDLVYGNKKSELYNTLAEALIPKNPTDDMNYPLTNMTSESPYFKKFFKAKASVDGIFYMSNSVYSGEAPVLSVERFKDDLVFNWPLVNNADSFKVYYKNDNTDDKYESYIPSDSGTSDDDEDKNAAWVEGTATSFTINDIIQLNSQYDNSDFKIAAVFDGFEIESNELEIDSNFTMPKIEGRYNGSGYEIMFTDMDNDVESIDILYIKTEEVDDVSKTVYELIAEDVSIAIEDVNDGEVDYTISSGDMSTYLDKKVLIRQHLNNNPIVGYSNTVKVNDSAIQGYELDVENARLNSDDDIIVRLGSRFEAVYNFKVLEDVYKPYFKISLKGNDYLNFDKITAKLIDFESESDANKKDSEGKTIPLKVAIANEQTTGKSYVYVYLQDETADGNVFNENHNYRLVLSTVTDVTSNESDDADADIVTRKEVYELLKAYGASEGKALENWALPYHIADIKDGSTELDNNMSLEYDVYWDESKGESSNDSRDITIDLFEYDLQLENKNELPSSL